MSSVVTFVLLPAQKVCPRGVTVVREFDRTAGVYQVGQFGPPAELSDGGCLGSDRLRWAHQGGVVEQRANQAEGSLDADRERRLEAVTAWSWDTRMDKWEDGFRRILDYVEQEGPAYVPRSYIRDGYRLGL
jgi:hypothetical protein